MRETKLKTGIERDGHGPASAAAKEYAEANSPLERAIVRVKWLQAHWTKLADRDDLEFWKTQMFSHFAEAYKECLALLEDEVHE